MAAYSSILAWRIPWTEEPGGTEADPLNGKLSNVSLVGQHLLGLKAGDKVEFLVPDGMARYRVVEVKR